MKWVSSFGGGSWVCRVDRERGGAASGADSKGEK